MSDKTMVACACCGDPIVIRPRYCSMRCWRKQVRDDGRYLVTVNCPICRKPFEQDRRTKKPKTCGYRCGAELKIKNKRVAQMLSHALLVLAFLFPSYASAQPAPTNLKSVPVSASRINLTWSQNGAVDGFRIERSANSGGFVQAATVGGNARQYQDTNLWAGTTYTYRIFYYKGNRVSAYTVAAPASTLPLAPPGVSAGSDTTINGPGIVALVGTVSTDGLRPTDTLSYLWTQVNGPTSAVIQNPDSLSTTANLSQAGVYVFRLTATIRTPSP